MSREMSVRRMHDALTVMPYEEDDHELIVFMMLVDTMHYALVHGVPLGDRLDHAIERFKHECREEHLLLPLDFFDVPIPRRMM